LNAVNGRIQKKGWYKYSHKRCKGTVRNFFSNSLAPTFTLVALTLWLLYSSKILYESSS